MFFGGTMTVGERRPISVKVASLELILRIVLGRVPGGGATEVPFDMVAVVVEKF